MPRDHVLLYDKPAGVTSHDVVARVRRGAAAQDQGRARRDARPVRDRAAAGARRPRHPGAAVLHGAAQALRGGGALRRGLDHRRPRGRDRRHRRRARRRPRSARRGGSASARRRTRQSRSAGGAPTSSRGQGAEVELAEREVEVYRFDELWRDGDRRAFVIECSSGTYVRSLIADLGDAYCEQLRRTRIGSLRRRRRRPRAAARAGAGAGFPARDRARRRAGHGGRPRARDRGHAALPARARSVSLATASSWRWPSPARVRRSCGRVVGLR